MPLNGFTSLCSKNAKQIVSRDKGNPQYHKANNVSNSEVTHYQIDGKVIKTGDRCDYLLMNETSKTAYLIELKGYLRSINGRLEHMEVRGNIVVLL